MSPVPDRRPRPAVLDIAATIFDAVLLLASLVSVILGSVPALMVWVCVAVAYLIVDLVLLRHQTVNDVRDGRHGAADTLSWAFPLMASLAGANTAVIALVARGEDAPGGLSTLAILGVIGIPVSWILLHLGFASIYSSTFERAPHGGEPLRFPDDIAPGPVEFVYFALTIGATFATSDVDVVSRRMRVIVAIHCVASFFYNALVVATTLQVLTRLTAA